MSYSQFGYTYPTSSQILVSGQPHHHPMSPCCPASGPGSAAEVPGGGGGGEARLLSSPFPRLAPAGFGLYGYAAAADHPLSTLAGTATSAFYPSLPSPYDLKESRSSWSALQPSSAPTCYPYDPSGLASCGPYADRYGTIDSVARRKNATRETTNTLKAWLYEHRKNPYPTKGEKIMLAIITKMTLTQVSTWFANARRRLKKENKMTWEPRNKTSEGDDRDSSSPREDNKSEDNTTTEEDSNMTSAGVSAIDFLKQESDVYVSGKHVFSDFDDPVVESKSLDHPGKSCSRLSSYDLNCYNKAAHSSEDSGTSGSPSPARPPLVQPCYNRERPGFAETGKAESDQKDAGVFCDETPPPFGPRPKIWSLARTATSNSPPLIRRYECPASADFCLVDGKEDAVCAKPGYSVPPYPDYPQDRTSAAQKTAKDLCCRPSVYGNVLPDCGLLPTKCESSECVGPPPNSCMVTNNNHHQCNYAAEYPANGGTPAEHYPYDKPFKDDKDPCAIEYAKCHTNLENKKLTPIMPYPGSDPGARTATDYYGFEQGMPPLHNSKPGAEMPDPVSLLRRNDH